MCIRDSRPTLELVEREHLRLLYHHNVFDLYVLLQDILCPDSADLMNAPSEEAHSRRSQFSSVKPACCLTRATLVVDTTSGSSSRFIGTMSAKASRRRWTRGGELYCQVPRGSGNNRSPDSSG